MPVRSKLGLGCSSFSDLFGGGKEDEWIATVHKALELGINVLDTSPWYGSSETLLGKALKNIPRSSYFLHTKVGRFDAAHSSEPTEMFDFTFDRTRRSVLNSISVMGCEYIDVAQVHDPEFAEDLSIVIDETLPALDSLRSEGLVRAIGVTGFPLEVQREIMERSTIKIDFSLTYGHLNLHDDTARTTGFFEFCRSKSITPLAAAPLSMGLLTNKSNPPDWHPAGVELRALCKRAGDLCESKGVDLPRLAITYALEIEDVETTFLGMSTTNEVNRNVALWRQGLSQHERDVLSEVLELFKDTRASSGWFHTKEP